MCRVFGSIRRDPCYISLLHERATGQQACKTSWYTIVIDRLHVPISKFAVSTTLEAIQCCANDMCALIEAWPDAMLYRQNLQAMI